MIKIVPAKESEVTRIKCPHCNERVARVCVKKGSKCEGLLFECRRCGMRWEFKSE